MNVVVRIRFSQARRFVPGVNWPNAAYALADVSWTRSSASVGFLVIRSAAGYSWPSWGMTSRSNRARSSLECAAWLMFAPVVCHLTVYRRTTGPETYPHVAEITLMVPGWLVPVLPAVASIMLTRAE